MVINEEEAVSECEIASSFILQYKEKFNFHGTIHIPL